MMYCSAIFVGCQSFESMPNATVPPFQLPARCVTLECVRISPRNSRPSFKPSSPKSKPSFQLPQPHRSRSCHNLPRQPNMDALKKFIEKKKSEAKFKKAGPGHRLSGEATGSGARASSSAPAPVPERQHPSKGSQLAGAAALARHEQKQQQQSASNRSVTGAEGGRSVGERWNGRG